MSKKQSDWDSQRTNRFCTVSFIPEQIADLQVKIKNYPFWAYINHLPDKVVKEDSDKKPHCHFMWKCKGTMSVLQVANQLDIPSHMIQPCRFERSYGRYFLHLDDKDKIQYSLSDVQTNKKSRFVIWSEDNQDDDVRKLFEDFKKLKRGVLKAEDFIGLHYSELQKLNLYQKIKTLEVLTKY